MNPGEALFLVLIGAYCLTVGTVALIAVGGIAWIVRERVRDRRQPEPEQSDAPNIYDLSGAYIERDPSLDMEADPETRCRIGFNAKEDQ